MRRAENLLTSLEGILSARVVTTPLGEVSEVHVLAQAGLQPKQLVRNIESALLAHLGLKIDHRKISIAQTADVKPLEALESTAVRDRSLQRAMLFENVTVLPAPAAPGHGAGVALDGWPGGARGRGSDGQHQGPGRGGGKGRALVGVDRCSGTTPWRSRGPGWWRSSIASSVHRGVQGLSGRERCC